MRLWKMRPVLFFGVLSLWGTPLESRAESEPVDCEVSGSGIGIVHVRVGVTDLEGQITAYTTVQKGPAVQNTWIRVSNGTPLDDRIFLFEEENGAGQIRVYYLEHAGARQSRISCYEPCGAGFVPRGGCPGDGLVFLGNAGIAHCTRSGQ